MYIDIQIDTLKKKQKTHQKEQICHQKKEVVILDSCYNKDNDFCLEIGIDEAGRGPMFGRLYVSAVIVPKDDSFDHSIMKDSKKFTSEKKIREAADYIKENALDYSIFSHDEKKLMKS